MIAIHSKNTALFSFVALTAIFTIVSLIFIYSSSSVFALQKLRSAHYFVKKTDAWHIAWMHWID